MRSDAGVVSGCGAGVATVGVRSTSSWGIVTLDLAPLGSTLACVCHLRVLGAVASMVCLPGSVGMGVFHSLRATGLPSLVIWRPSTSLVGGTVMVRRLSDGSSAAAR